MKKFMYAFLILSTVVISCGSGSGKKQIDQTYIPPVTQDDPEGKVHYLSTQNFIDQIFDFRTETEWKYKGDKPAIIDFYADWCGPCKRVAPIMKELALEYKGEINFYKVNTDYEQELAYVFGIQSIPSIMFIPMEGKPHMYIGAFPKNEYIRLINEIFYPNKQITEQTKNL